MPFRTTRFFGKFVLFVSPQAMGWTGSENPSCEYKIKDLNIFLEVEGFLVGQGRCDKKEHTLFHQGLIWFAARSPPQGRKALGYLVIHDQLSHCSFSTTKFWAKKHALGTLSSHFFVRFLRLSLPLHHPQGQANNATFQFGLSPNPPAPPKTERKIFLWLRTVSRSCQISPEKRKCPHQPGNHAIGNRFSTDNFNRSPTTTDLQPILNRASNPQPFLKFFNRFSTDCATVQVLVRQVPWYGPISQTPQRNSPVPCRDQGLTGFPACCFRIELATGFTSESCEIGVSHLEVPSLYWKA